MSNSISSSSPPGSTRRSMLTRRDVSQPELLFQRLRRMDCRIKSGNDEGKVVARVERSEIRVRSRSFHAAPGFRFALPGLRRNKRKEADRRQTRYSTTRTQAAHRARRGYGGLRRPSASGALACRRSTTALAAATERHRSAPVHALPGGGTTQERVLSVPCRSSAAGFNPQTGHSAGRAFWPKAAREPRLTRPKPAGTVLAPSRRRHPAVSFLGRDSSLYVAISGTIVNGAGTWKVDCHSPRRRGIQ